MHIFKTSLHKIFVFFFQRSKTDLKNKKVRGATNKYFYFPFAVITSIYFKAWKSLTSIYNLVSFKLMYQVNRI
jgi:hypothetical protein